MEEKAYLTDAFTREGVDFIHRHADKPFFLYMAYNAVHSPLQGAEKYMRRFAHIEDIHRRIFAAMLANLDDSVGGILKAVRENGLEENTLIIFMSDNGGPTRELTSSNLPFRGEKGQMYEGGLRVPMAMQWKGNLPEGIAFNGLTTSVDLFATIAHFFDQPTPKMDGVNLIPYLTGTQEGNPHDTFFWRQGKKTAMRRGDWKLINMKGTLANPKWELYHLGQDPTESNDLSGSNQDVLSELTQQWKAYQKEMIPSIF